MSILECRLAAQKEKDGKPFTVCEVETWFYAGLSMATHELPSNVKKAAKHLYDQFGNGKDKSERGATLDELLLLPSNGGLMIIPSTADNFVPVTKWKEMNNEVLRIS